MPRKLRFSRFLRDARIKRRLSVAEVAEQVGVSQSSIYFWETDRARPREANLNALCKVLKLPIVASRPAELRVAGIPLFEGYPVSHEEQRGAHLLQIATAAATNA